MKKILGILILGALIAFGCNKEKEYEPAKPESGAQYFFPVSTPLSYTITDETEGFDFTIRRMVKDAAAEIIVAVEDTSKTVFPEGFADLKVEFAAGQEEAKITLPISRDKYDYGDKYGLDLEISEQTTVYAPGALHIEIELPEPWVSLGKGTWVSSWLFGETFEDVEFFQNQVQPNHFRFAYAQAIADKFEEDPADWPEFFEFWILKPGDVLYNYLTITQEDLVTWTPIFDTGYYLSSYGLNISAVYPTAMYIISGGYYDIGTEANVMNSRVEYYQDANPELPAVVSLAPVYYLFQPDGSTYGGWPSTWQSANVTLVFPGVVLADYAVDIEYTGLFNKADGDVYAMADVTLGDDVEYAMVAIAAGNDEDALYEAYDLILAEAEKEEGEDPSEFVTTIKMSETKPVEGVDENEEPKTFHVGEIRLPLPELDENYCLVVIPFGGGKAQEKEAIYTAFQYKDFGISLTLAEPETDSDGNASITATVEFGEDTESALAVLAPGKKNDRAALMAALQLIMKGDDSVVEIEKSGDVVFPLEEEGDFIVMVASVAEGELWNIDYDGFEYHAVDPWETMGYILYTDDAVSPLFGVPAPSYWIPIQKNNLNEGLFKLINPYHDPFPYISFGALDDSKDHNIIIDVTNPAYGVFSEQPIGIDWGYGEMSLVSSGQYWRDQGYSDDVITGALGDIFIKYADGKITFPPKSIRVKDDDGYYTPSASEGFVLDLNDVREAAPASTPSRFSPKTTKKIAVKNTVKSLGPCAFPKTLKSAAVVTAKGRVAARGKSTPVLR